MEAGEELEVRLKATGGNAGITPTGLELEVLGGPRQAVPAFDDSSAQYTTSLRIPADSGSVVIRIGDGSTDVLWELGPPL